MTSFGWAKYPMIKRITDIESSIPITMIYGSRSWMDSNIGYEVKYLRNQSFVDIQVSPVIPFRPIFYGRWFKTIPGYYEHVCDTVPAEMHHKGSMIETKAKPFSENVLYFYIRMLQLIGNFFDSVHKRNLFAQQTKFYSLCGLLVDNQRCRSSCVCRSSNNV